MKKKPVRSSVDSMEENHWDKVSKQMIQTNIFTLFEDKKKVKQDSRN